MKMQLPLSFQNGHYFTTIDGADWIIDTGSPTSFGTSISLQLADQKYEIVAEYMGLDGKELSQYVNHPTSGIIGSDILNDLDVILDTRNNILELSHDTLSVHGTTVPLTSVLGVPIVIAIIENAEHQMFFDTASPISYFQEQSLANYPSLGEFQDFYPGYRRFTTATNRLPIELESEHFELRCGTLPQPLAMALSMAGASGIIGNETMGNRILGYFSRRNVLIFG
ncbi:hypothetical protein [Candidatus Symbiobacter mobilis]|uniref:Aspartyl protease n=1 Tax=Candidatus Symbiobacter mobilis CR TaxID=946483 RepID=U5NAK2_9BURK|nr:hypothetical protein [Candidatus Symbiobacter mobilis]AGX88325.1 hypothetical protein Cenrod_2261 [Candidatus Symbiobacter mobilis CR]